MQENAAYPYIAEEFGQLDLPKDVVKTKFISLNNYGAVVAPPKTIKNRTSRHFAAETEKTGNFLLFTVDANDYMTIYKIKSYLSSPMSNVITNFKMAKRSSLLLEYPVRNIEWITSTNAS